MPTEELKPTSPRELRRLQRIQISREQILDTAEEMFGAAGFHDTGLREIAEECEFSVGSLYSFFENKQDLFQAVLKRRGTAEQRAMADLAVSEHAADDILVAMAELQVTFFRQYPAWSRIMLGFLTPGPGVRLIEGEFGHWYRVAYQDAMDIQAGIIERGQLQGVVRAGNPQALARLFSALVSSYHLMDSQLSADPLDFEVAQFLEFVRTTFSTRTG